MMFSPKIIVYSVLITSFVASSACAEILFQDNFDNSPDWQSNQTVNKSVYPDGYDISWAQTRADKCTTLCPPQGWTSYRAASSYWTDDRRKDTYILSAEGARGGSGKGITYNIEVSGYYGNWAGGSLDLWLGETGYNELYVRYYLKFDPAWQWTNPEDTEHGLMKLLRLSTFNDNIWTTSSNPQGYGSSYLNNPVFFPDMGHNAGLKTTGFSYAERFAPNYTFGEERGISGAAWPVDGDWHCYEYYVKMNSSPGVADGIWRIYLDGVIVGESTTVEWKMAGSNSTGWNWLMFIDNGTFASAPLSDHVEMQLYMDDVVVSTEYIGLDPSDPKANRQIILNVPSF